MNAKYRITYKYAINIDTPRTAIAVRKKIFIQS